MPVSDRGRSISYWSGNRVRVELYRNKEYCYSVCSDDPDETGVFDL